MNKFSELLIKKREEKGMLKKEAAKFFGWTAMYYGRFEKGNLLPTKRNIKYFAKFLEIAESEIMELIKNIKGVK